MLVLAGRGGEADWQVLHALGVRAVYPKPIDHTVLTRRLDRMISSADSDFP